RTHACACELLTVLRSSARHLHLFLSLTLRPPPTSTLFPYTTLFRSRTVGRQRGWGKRCACDAPQEVGRPDVTPLCIRRPPAGVQDRKSTRLNSSHEWISYAVFCLKKKKSKQGQR